MSVSVVWGHDLGSRYRSMIRIRCGEKSRYSWAHSSNKTNHGLAWSAPWPKRGSVVCPDLARLCSQNGWIDNDTLEVEVLEQGRDTLLAAVTFEEVIMEGAGCIAGRVPCYGRVRARLDPSGRIESIEVV